MIIPFDCEDLFELNDNLQPQFDGEVIIIDNIFKNYSKILEICQNTPVENWKKTPESRNFKDYYDCKLKISNWYPSSPNRLNTLLSIVDYYFNLSGNIMTHNDFQFNYYKSKILNLPNTLQHHPHKDPYYNCLFFIDTHNNGGTAIYEDAITDNTEHLNLLYDISNLKIKKIIPHIPNRCVIFSGEHLHGGYIKDHNIYYYNWRINLVNFLFPKDFNLNN